MSAADSAALQPSASDVSAGEAPTSKTSDNGGEVTPQGSSKAEKDKKRRFFGLGKRKDSGDKTPTKEAPPSSTSAPHSPVPPSNSSTAPLEIPRVTPRSPSQAQQGRPLSMAVSPARSGRLRSHSPASSSIFERNVQENTLPDDVAKEMAIPSHIQTEDYIPPVLEASSLAITDNHLGPDEVEIVMHSAHQPAAEKVVGGTHTPAASDAGASPIGGLSPIEDSGINLHQSLEASGTLGAPFSPISALGDDASNYGGLDTSDVRRLSFISFADVVQSEQAESSRDSVMHMSALSHGSSATGGANRSPSPVRSPASMGTSPPTSGAPSMKGLDIDAAVAGVHQAKGAAARLPPGSPTSGAGHAPREGGEIVVETMRQALRKTGSGDLRGAMSPVDKVTHEDESGAR